MEERNLQITINTARDWYYGDNEALKNLALTIFTVDELQENWRRIKSLADAKEEIISYSGMKLAVPALQPDWNRNINTLVNLNIILRALNGSDYKWCDDAWITNVYIVDQGYELARDNILGTIKIAHKPYYIVMGDCVHHHNNIFGMSAKDTIVCDEVRKYFGFVDANFAYFACKTKEISKHFTTYFYKEIVEFILSKYTDNYEWQ
jgi:hypothetical protein